MDVAPALRTKRKSGTATLGCADEAVGQEAPPREDKQAPPETGVSAGGSHVVKRTLERIGEPVERLGVREAEELAVRPVELARWECHAGDRVELVDEGLDALVLVEWRHGHHVLKARLGAHLVGDDVSGLGP